MKDILLLGRHPELLKKIVAAIEAEGYTIDGVTTDTETIEKLNKNQYGALVFGGGVEANSVQTLSNVAKQRSETLKILIAHPNTIFKQLQDTLGKATP